MNTNEFFFDSDLRKERKQQIVDWVNSLPKENQQMIADLRSDAAEEAVYFANESEDC